SRYFRPLGREWLSHGTNYVDRRRLKAGSFLLLPRENEDERRLARLAAPPNAPFPDNANPHGRWRFRTSTSRFRITSVPCRVSRECLRKDRAEPCPEIPRVVPFRRSRAPRRAERHLPRARCRAPPRHGLAQLKRQLRTTPARETLDP